MLLFIFLSVREDSFVRPIVNVKAIYWMVIFTAHI